MYIGLNFIRHSKRAKTKAIATLGYNETRLGKDGAEIERQLFGKSGPLTKEQAEWQINAAPARTYFWRMRLSPDPNGENAGKKLDLWELTRDAVRWLEERLGRPGEIGLIGAEHNDHTEIAHIHAILLIERRGREKILTKDDLNAFREAVAQMALGQRLDRQLATQRQVAQQEAQQRQQVQQDEAKQQVQHQHYQGQHHGLQFQHQAQAVQGTQVKALAASRHLDRPVGPAYYAARNHCTACQGEEAQKQLLLGIEHCSVCGRYLGQGRELSLSR